MLDSDARVVQFATLNARYNLQGSLRVLAVDMPHGSHGHACNLPLLLPYCTNLRQLLIAADASDEDVPLDETIGSFVEKLTQLQAVSFTTLKHYFLFDRTTALLALTGTSVTLQRLRIVQGYINTSRIDLSTAPSFQLTSLHLHYCAIDGSTFKALLAGQKAFVRDLLRCEIR